MMAILRDRLPLVLAIGVPVLLIGSAAYTGMATRYRMAKHTHARLRMRDLQEALVRYGAEHAEACPRSMDVLIAHGYLRRPLTDDWGTPLAFSCTRPFSSDSALAVSAGPDRTFGTADDIRSDRD